MELKKGGKVTKATNTPFNDSLYNLNLFFA
jgi:hypothetical protein